MKFNILILCDFNRNSANTIIDHATCFKKYSRHNIFYFNPVGRNKPDWLNLTKFDVLMIHYSIYVLGDSYINHSWRYAIAESPAVKIQFIQDEYRHVNAIIDRMRELKINILYTCFPEQEIEKVYPEEKLPGVKKINTLTGYVPSYLENSEPDFHSGQPIDVGYRGRGEGLWWLGHLYQEKSIIGREFLRHATDTDLKCDISTGEEDRIYGKKWLEFLRRCRCTLGTESGASVIDFTGDIENRVRSYCERHPSASFGEVRDLFFKDVEGTIRMNQISPRLFEAIGCGCCMILFEGEYSGILTQGIHYIELKKDFGNIKDVFDSIRDRPFIKEMAMRAYEDIILPGTYSYKAFVASFDKDLDHFMCAALKQGPSEMTLGVYPFPGEHHLISTDSTDSVTNHPMPSPGPHSSTVTGRIGMRNHSLFSRTNEIPLPGLYKLLKVLRFVLGKFVRVFRAVYYIIRLFYDRLRNAFIYRFYQARNLLRRITMYHPFFLAEKFRVISKIIRQL